MYYRPRRTLGLLVGSVLTLWALGIGLVLLNYGLTSELSVGGFLAYSGAACAALLVLLFGFWTYSLWTLAYTLDRNALIISWGPTQQVLPLSSIERIVPGMAVGVPAVRGLAWWGCHIGEATIDRVGAVLFYSAHQVPEDVLYVMTSEQTYALSLDHHSEFAREILRRQELGPTVTLEHHVRRSDLGLLTLWEDSLGLMIAGMAVATGALTWLHLAIRYKSLPAMISLHLPASDTLLSGSFVERSELIELSQIATTILLAGLLLGVLVHRYERMAGYLVFGGAVVVQVIFVVGTLFAIS